ncbi:MAG: metal-dependent transcriptional regulator [Candidatus Margulisbacteria bacterium]|nr:metal-dependent transcriptional regulator [Candidatus Margulisiibacteriota bacterium]MBU1867732.1 metal-dependent transcriptional regulator [Candidatus Margulisiibacteriota bacterium]
MKKLSANMENYLETILTLENENGGARIKDIAARLGIKMPSVTEALAKLKAAKLISHEKYGTVSLNKKGRELATEIAERNLAIMGFLHNVLKVDEQTAREDAARVGFGFSQQTLEKMRMQSGSHRVHRTMESEKMNVPVEVIDSSKQKAGLGRFFGIFKN